MFSDVDEKNVKLLKLPDHLRSLVARTLSSVNDLVSSAKKRTMNSINFKLVHMSIDLYVKSLVTFADAMHSF